MDWIRVSTDLALDRLPDAVIAANVRYQSLWAHKEREPASEEALRHMTPTQLARALEYRDSIKSMVEPDIESVQKKRGREKKSYYKSKGLTEIPTDGTTGESSIVSSRFPPVPPMPQTIYDKNKLTTNKNKKDVVVADKTQFIARRGKGFAGMNLPPMFAPTGDKNG